VTGLKIGVTVILIIPDDRDAEIVAISDSTLDTVPYSEIFTFVPSKIKCNSVPTKELDGECEI